MPVTLESLGIDSLSVHDKLDLIERIWDSLPDKVAADEIPAWHLPILEQRLASLKANPSASRPWEEALDEIAVLHGRAPLV